MKTSCARLLAPLALVAGLLVSGRVQAIAGEANRTLVLAGGCFWCMEKPFEELDGVLDVVSGYAGGHVDKPSYKQVSGGGTGHREVVQITYDPERVSFSHLLDVFWRNIDPLDGGGQFCDRGFQYTSAIFVGDDSERKAAEASKTRIAERLGEAVKTEIVEGGKFYPAEAYHQDFYKTHSIQYRFYRWKCGRDARLEELWGDS